MGECSPPPRPGGCDPGRAVGPGALPCSLHPSSDVERRLCFEIVQQNLLVHPGNKNEAKIKKECIPVGCVPAARRPYTGVWFPGAGCAWSGGVWSGGGCTWSGGVSSGGVCCLVCGVSALGGVPGLGGLLRGGGVCLSAL